MNMEMDQSKVVTLANDLSNLVLNKVLARDMTIHEALKATISTVVYIMAKSMPADRFDKELDKSIPLSTAIVENLRNIIEERKLLDNPINLTELLLAINNTLEYIVDKTE